MKNKMLLTLALGLAGATSLMAGTVDVYITGSTAFRANVYTACSKLFVGGPTKILFGDSAHGGDANDNASTASWAMTGTPISTLTNLQNNTLNIHGLFTGSIQGIQTVEQSVVLTWADVTGGTLVSGNVYTATAYVNKTPTIGFSDASGASSPYPASGNYAEENVCVQPFVMAKAVGSGAAATAMSKISNVSWEQMEYGIPAGRLPLSSFTYNQADTNTWVYLVQRTADSGTRRCETAGEYFQFNDPINIYVYDRTNDYWYLPTDYSSSTTYGSYPNGVVGPAGYGNANLNWGTGYVGGGDIKNSLNLTGTNNSAIAYLSIGDAKGVNGSAGNWANVVSFNGMWPTTAGSNIRSNTVTSTGFTGAGTNDFSPITSGFYPCWGNEVLVHVIDPAQLTVNDQDITKTQLGNQLSPGSFMGVLNAQTLLSTNLNGTPVVGSIEEEIELSKTNLATGIRLSDMNVHRPSVGGTIYPF